MNQIMRLPCGAYVPGVAATLFVFFLVLSPPDAQAAEQTGEQSASLSVEGISANIGEDNPRVLYILPWQTPSLPRRPRAELDSDAPQLMQPLNPLVLERHRTFRQTLNPLVLNPEKGSAVTVQ
jgi:hypothetical protein